MAALTGGDPDASYETRIEFLRKKHIAVWDVLASSVRPGSLDTDIDVSTAMPNDFPSFLSVYSEIRLVCFNGQKAAGVFGKLVLSRHPGLRSDRRYETLPSTSPAFASMSFDEKLRKWSIVLPDRSDPFFDT